MEFRILGPLEVVDQGRPLALGGAKQRALLAALIVRPNEIVSSDQLIEDLWSERPPGTAAKVIQVYVSQLRKTLREEGRLLTRPPGYLLRADPDELDQQRFERLFEAGRGALAAGDAQLAAARLREALALWRGGPLADLAYEPFAQVEIARLEERRVAALIERIEADLALGRHDDLIGELETLVAHHPLQERLRGQLMVALYRAGRQGEALQVYQDARRVLAEELGLGPGQPLQRLEQAILTQDPEIDPPRREPPVARQESGEQGLAGGDVTFAELVWEHFQWEHERRTGGLASREAERRYRRKLASFEHNEGKIVDSYWCQHEASAAALTVQRPALFRRLLGADPRIRVHRVSDWITRDAPEVAALLFRCDALAIRAGDELRGTGKLRALQRVFSAQTHLLGLLDRTGGRPTEAQTAEAAQQTSELLEPAEAALGSPAATGEAPAAR